MCEICRANAKPPRVLSDLCSPSNLQVLHKQSINYNIFHSLLLIPKSSKIERAGALSQTTRIASEKNLTCCTRNRILSKTGVIEVSMTSIREQHHIIASKVLILTINNNVPAEAFPCLKKTSFCMLNFTMVIVSRIITQSHGFRWTFRTDLGSHQKTITCLSPNIKNHSSPRIYLLSIQ